MASAHPTQLFKLQQQQHYQRRYLLQGRQRQRQPEHALVGLQQHTEKGGRVVHRVAARCPVGGKLGRRLGTAEA